MSKKIIKPENEIFVVTIGNEYITFLKRQLAFNHIAQGTFNDTSFMVTFCVICNSGMVLNPKIEDKTYHLYVAGVYNGMMMARDKETGSYWDHITGECVYGKMKGAKLSIMASHRIMQVKQALDTLKDPQFALQKLSLRQHLMSRFQSMKANPQKAKGFLPPGFRKSIAQAKEDSRLPSMEMGLGVWANDHAMFYPMSSLKKSNNLILDKIDNKSIIIYLEPVSRTPMAIYSTAVPTGWQNDKLIFENDNYLKNGVLFSPAGNIMNGTAPNHLFSRWYGFSRTFPDCTIGGGK